MIRFAPLLVACLLFAPGLAAQTVMRPQLPLDSARLQRDYRQASAASLLSRARVMREACARSVRTVGPSKQALQETKLSKPRWVKEKGKLVGAMDQLSGVLTRCETEFASMSRPGQAETVRGYANDRAVRIQSAIRKYEQAMREFLGVLGVRVPPLGATPHELAG